MRERSQETEVRSSGGGKPGASPDSCLLTPDSCFILASRSPRRLELLSLLVPRERITVLPPESPHEEPFDGLRTRREIESRLLAIARAKCDDVLRRLGDAASRSVVIAADTVIVVGESDGDYVVLGQPPEAEWRETTRRWFLDHYAGRSHLALTGLCIAAPAGRRETVVASRVTFCRDVAAYLDWYLATGEPRGKAGGYGLQGAGSLFVDRIEGSPTNVIGLPLRELSDILRELAVPLGNIDPSRDRQGAVFGVGASRGAP